MVILPLTLGENFIENCVHKYLSLPPMTPLYSSILQVLFTVKTVKRKLACHML